MGGIVDAALARASSHAAWLATPHPPSSWASLLDGPLTTLVVPWAVQLVFSWLGFSIFAAWDYAAFTASDPAKQLPAVKLPSRHPVHEAEGAAEGGWVARGLALVLGRPPSPFLYNQAMMVPLVLYNQLVVWPLVSMAVVWPAWAAAHAPASAWSSTGALAATFVVCILTSDLLWYASHRLMHTPYAWRALHKMHHVAPQVAISATYVHPWEYALFTASTQLPFALAGFPVWLHAVPLAWGMMTGSGAHSGYAGPLANGEKHNGHHYFHNVNFGLLMIGACARRRRAPRGGGARGGRRRRPSARPPCPPTATARETDASDRPSRAPDRRPMSLPSTPSVAADIVFGTHWAPGDAPPPAWEEATAIAKAYKSVVGSDNSKAFALGATVG